jgi:TetR/AcrR family transcriptional regulator, fatty acid metabolism regulator protein
MAMKPSKRNTDKFNRIIQAAFKVFARKGFYNAKVAEIAREARVADGTIYLYFQNKDDILINLFEVKMDLILHNMKERLAAEKDPLKKIEIFALEHLKMMENSKELAEVVQVEMRQSSKFMKEYKNDKFFEYLKVISDIVEQGQATGIFRNDIVPGIAKRAFFGALDEMSRYWVLSSTKKYDVETAAKEISRLFLNGMGINAPL